MSTSGEINRLQVRVPTKLAAWITDRGDRMGNPGPNLQTRAELALWRSALQLELRTVRLTLAQLNCLAHALHGYPLPTTLAPATGAGMAYLETRDVFDHASSNEQPYSRTWDIDETLLLNHLCTLNPTADHALLDAVNRWWTTNQEPTSQAWNTVGIRPLPTPTH